MGKFQDLTGQRFGRLTVLGFAGRKKPQILWECQCDCGNKKIVTGNALRTNGTRSCGCLADESRKNVAPKVTTHGDSKTRLYRIHSAMKQRCYNPNRERYKDYGGKHITICKEWLEKGGYEAFKEWALSNGYRDNLTIDRIDNEKGYSPENCRWVDMKTQSNNKRMNIFVEYNQETHTASEWAEILDIHYTRLLERLKRGETIEEILKNPPRKYMERENSDIRQILKDNNIMQKQVAEELGIRDHLLTDWMNQPLSEEKKEMIINSINKIINDKA